MFLQNFGEINQQLARLFHIPEACMRLKNAVILAADRLKADGSIL
jgi:hypothetical protein